MEQDVRSLLLDFFKRLGCSDTVDETVIEYACGLLESIIDGEGDDYDEDLLHLDFLLAGACGAQYEAEEQRQHQLATVVQAARTAKQMPSQPPAAPVQASASRPATTTAKAMHRSQGSSGSSGTGGGGGTCGGRENLSPASDLAEARNTPAVVQELLALFSEAVSQEFLVYAFECKFQGDAQALAAWLLDCDRRELQAAESAWQELHEREMREQEEARLLKERNKQHILEKFDLRPVPQPKDPKKAGKAGPPLDAWAGKQIQQAQQPKVRYLDGRVVTTKGEKFVIEKAGEEWDGGSRGKVYTKGKRGKGFM